MPEDVNNLVGYSKAYLEAEKESQKYRIEI